MITLKDVHKSFGAQTLLENVSLQINQGDRFALVGPNGAGKSTLFKILLGTETADSGAVSLRRNAKVGYLPQENPPVSELTVLAEALAGLEEWDSRDEARIKAFLMGLGFRAADFEKRVDSLSGGWAMRVALARLLAQEPDLLLLDEPTNHLDLDSLFWFQKYLASYPGAVFLISHDRSFINAVCRGIVSLEGRGLRVYHGDYELYVEQRRAEKERLEAAWRRQQDEIARMRDFIDRNRARASTASRAQSMIKRLEKLELIELPQEQKSIKIRFPQPRRVSARVMTLSKVNKSYGETKVYQGLDFELERGWKMAFVGHNGAGKSTLLKMLAGVVPIDSGERRVPPEIRVGYFSQHRAGQLDFGKTVLEEALSASRENSELMVRTVLGSFLFSGDSVGKKVSVLSGGEKSRLSLVKLLLNPPNVLLMDEPTTHLDMAGVDALVSALKGYEGTACFISHDIHFLNALADHVVHVENGRVTVYPGDYDYFKRRQAQWREENLGAVAVPPKEKKREKAAGPDPRRAAKRLSAIESELASLHRSLESLASQLSDPGLYSDYSKVEAIGREMEKAQSGIQDLESEIARLKSGS